MKNGEYISKQEAGALQGMAVSMMVVHHLFGFPERIHVDYKLIMDVGTFSIETILAYVFRFCIAIFAFSSGYGLYKKCSNMSEQGLLAGYCLIGKQLFNFFKRYWMVLVVFLPIGFIQGVYQPDLLRILKSVIGFSSAYNAEWWYAGTYIQLMLFFPLAYAVLRRLGQWMHRWVLAVSVMLISVMVAVFRAYIPNYTFVLYFLCMLQGMMCVETGVFEALASVLKKQWITVVTATGVMLILMGIRFFKAPGCDMDYLFVAGFVFFAATVFKISCLKTVWTVLQFIGKYSTYIWLTHTFFAYYYFQAFTYMPYYSVLIFIWCVMLSIGFGMAAEFILGLPLKRKRAKHA